MNIVTLLLTFALGERSGLPLPPKGEPERRESIAPELETDDDEDDHEFDDTHEKEAMTP